MSHDLDRLARAAARLDALTNAAPRVESPGRAARVASGAAALASALVGFVLTVLLLGAWIDRHPGVRLDEGSYQRSKVVYFGAHADEFDIVYLGSSRVWRQVMPAVVGEELARRGHPLEGFNLGLPGATFPEVMAQALALAADRPERLRYVACELRPLFPKLFAENDLSRRQIEWHTPALLRLLLPAVLRSDRPLRRRLGRTALHLRHGFYRWANVGLVLPTLRRELGLAHDVDPDALHADGCQPIDIEARTRPELRRRELEFLRNKGELTQGIADLRGTAPRAAEPWELDLLTAFIARLRAAGLEPVFFLTAPTWDPLGEFRDAYARGVLPSLFAYNDPDRYPAFYSARHMFDYGHMRSSGAELFSRELGRDLARLLAAGE